MCWAKLKKGERGCVGSCDRDQSNKKTQPVRGKNRMHSDSYEVCQKSIIKSFS